MFLWCFSNYNVFKAVEETFEQELHQAILLSKLAYEEQLVSVAKATKEQDQASKKSGKKSKKATMSLDEFNNMGTNAAAAAPPSPPVVLTTNESSDNKSKGVLCREWQQLRQQSRGRFVCCNW